MSPSVKKIGVLALKLLVAGGLIYWLLSSGRLDFRQFAGIGGNWPWLLAAQVLFALNVLLSGLRWQYLLDAQGIGYTLRSTSILTLIGLFFNQVAFGSTGGDVYKAYAVARGSPENRSGAIVSVFVDRAFGLFALLVLVPAAAVLNLDIVRMHVELATFALGALAMLVLGAAVVGVYFSNLVRRGRMVGKLVAILPFREALEKVHLAVDAYRFHRRTVYRAAALSLIIQLLIVATNVCLARALIDGFDWWPFLLLIPAAHLAMAVPINPPGALGTAEALYAYLFELVHIGHGGLIALLQRGTFVLWALFGAVIFIVRKDWPALTNPATAQPSGAAQAEEDSGVPGGARAR